MTIVQIIIGRKPHQKMALGQGHNLLKLTVSFHACTKIGISNMTVYSLCI